MSLWKVSVSITKLSKRPANYRARSLCALSQRHCMSWVTWILLAEVILSEVKGHHLSLLTFNKLNTAVQTALDFSSDSTELGAQKSWFTRIYWCLTSGANPVHISFFFSISPQTALAATHFLHTWCSCFYLHHDAALECILLLAVSLSPLGGGISLVRGEQSKPPGFHRI